MPSLPDGFRLRSPVPEDAESALAVILARDVADVGYPDYSLDDVLADWSGHDAWVIEDAGGAIVATACLDAQQAAVYVHPDACGRGIGTVLRLTVEARLRELGQERAAQFVAGTNDDGRALLAAGGYEVTQRYYRMKVDFEAEPTAAPVWPAEVALTPFAPGEDDERVWRLVDTCFAEIEGNVPVTLEDWRQRRVQRDDAAFDAWVLAVGADGALVGVAVNDMFATGAGYVAQLAVDPAWRGRGLGRALLLESFARFRAHGLVAGELSVHSRNVAGLALYESVGLHLTWQAERYEKPLDVDAPVTA